MYRNTLWACCYDCTKQAKVEFDFIFFLKAPNWDIQDFNFLTAVFFFTFSNIG